MNGMIRMSKFTKLYKLVKIARLLRLFKLMKLKNKKEKKKKEQNKLGNNQTQLGPAFERLTFFVAVLFMLAHIFGCIWIFVGKSLSDNTIEEG